MTPPDTDHHANPTPPEPDFDAFLKDTAKVAEHQELYRRVSEESMIGLLYAARKYNIDLGSTDGTENIDDPDRAGLFRAHFSESVMLLSMLYAQATEENDVAGVEDITVKKKQIMAGYMTTGCMKQDDNWYKLFNESTPGAPLDENDVDDSVYFIESMAHLDVMDAHQPEFDEISDRVLSIIEEHVTEHSLDYETLERVVLEILTIFETSLEDTPHLESTIDELARKELISIARATELKKLGIQFNSLTRITG